MIPAVTTILAVMVGTGLNSIETRRLERQKFQFEVLKYTLGATDDPSRRLRLICQFVAIGFIEDVDHQYGSAVVDGKRPCAPPYDGQPFTPAAAAQQLAAEIGIATDQSGRMSFELGFLKFGGHLADVRVPSDRQVRPSPVRQVLLGVLKSSAADWPLSEMRRNEPRRLPQFIVRRDGSLIQIGSLYAASKGIVRIALVNAGKVRFGTEGRGIAFQMRGRSGAVASRSDFVAFERAGTDTIGRQRFTALQLQTAARLTTAICGGWPGLKATTTAYVRETVGFQGDAGQMGHCDGSSAAHP